MIVYSDGAARGNPGPAGIGAVVRSSRGRVLAREGKGIGIATNNVAEYRAALEGLRQAAKLGAGRVTLRSDSRLLVEQLAGRFRVKNPTLQSLHQEVREVMKDLDDVGFEHVPREANSEADSLANEGVDEWLRGPGKGYRRPPPDPALFG